MNETPASIGSVADDFDQQNPARGRIIALVVYDDAIARLPGQSLRAVGAGD
jgi:hypothetical protein